MLYSKIADVFFEVIANLRNISTKIKAELCLKVYVLSLGCGDEVVKDKPWCAISCRLSSTVVSVTILNWHNLIIPLCLHRYLRMTSFYSVAGTARLAIVF